MEQSTNYQEIDLIQLLQILWRRLWIIALAAVLFAGAAFAGTYFFITPTYESSALLYVNNSSFSLGSTNFSISNSELSAAQSLVNTYIVILNTRSTLNEVIEEAGLDYSYEDLSEMIEAAPMNDTEVFSVTVTSTNPYEAEKIANTISAVLPEKISDVVDGSDVRIVDYAIVPAHRSAPSYTKNTAIGLLLGIVLSVAVILLREMTDTIVRSEEHLTRAFDIPVLATIPNMAVPSKGKSYSRYAAKPAAKPAAESERR